MNRNNPNIQARPTNPRFRPPRRRRPEPNMFFGWNNTKWFIREFGKMYSGQNSYFSKKRIESGFSFVVGQAGMIMFLLFKYQDLTMSDFIMWASLEFAVGGYITWQIQRQKGHYGGYGGGYSGGYDDDYQDYGNDDYSQEYQQSNYSQDQQEGQEPDPTPPGQPARGRTNYPV